MSGWVTPTDITAADAASLKSIYDLTDGANWTNNTNWGETEISDDWYGIGLNGNRVWVLDIDSNNLVGDVSTWLIPTGIQTLFLRVNPGLEGDISGWILPSTLASYYLYSTSVSGDISSWVIPAALENCWIYSTSLSGAPDFTGAVKLQRYRYNDCGLSQADVDANLLGIYNRRASFTNALPSSNIGGSNAAPSGVYQDATPPTTGNEYKYKLVVDPDAEGFSKWTINSS